MERQELLETYRTKGYIPDTVTNYTRSLPNTLEYKLDNKKPLTNEEMLEQINLEHLDKQKADKIRQIFKENIEVLQRSTYDLPKTPLLTAEPRINPRYSNACLSCKFTNIPLHWQKPVAAVLHQLEENDIIRKADQSKPTNVLSALLIRAKPGSAKP